MDQFEIQWRESSFDGYDVSNTGLVRSKKSKHFGKLVSQMDHQCGYKRLRLCVDGVKKAVLVHRLVAEAFCPNPLKLKYVNHIDGDKANNVYTNLQWCTSGDNQRHAYSTGLKQKMKPAAKLTQTQVDNIRRLFSEGIKEKELASIFPVTKCTINKIINRRLWP